MKPNIIYLHGFASSPGGIKGQYIKQRLEGHEITLQIPDLNQPSFEHLTLTAMLEHLAEVINACPPGPVYLIGSSMGGLVAVHFINRYRETLARRVELLFLLAPALDFMEIRLHSMGEAALTQWEESGWLTMHHYATEKDHRVHYGLVEDIAAYKTEGLHIEIPVMIYHGKHDESVPYTQSEKFAADRNNVQLKLVDSDHTLHDQLEPIWKDIVSFFAL